MSHPMDGVLTGLDAEFGRGQGAKIVAKAFGEALERLLDTPEGEEAFISWLKGVRPPEVPK